MNRCDAILYGIVQLPFVYNIINNGFYRLFFSSEKRKKAHILNMGLKKRKGKKRRKRREKKKRIINLLEITFNKPIFGYFKL